MPNLQPFLSESREQIMSTTENWTRFTFVMLMGTKNIQIDELLEKQQADLTDADKLHLQIAKATFITTLGDRTIDAIKNQTPKDAVLQQDLKWIKHKWESNWNEVNNQNHLLIRLLKAKRGKRESIFDYWNRLTRISTECKLDSKSTAEIISALIVAMFTVSVNDEERVKAVWEKSLKHDELSKHIAKLHQTNQILHQVSVEPVQIKQEPMGRVRDRERRSDDNYPKKKGVCIRCGESWSKTHMEKRTAKTKTCNICEKEGHLAKVCKPAKSNGKEAQRPKIRKIEEEKEENSEDDDSEETMKESSESEDTPEEDSYSESSEEEVQHKEEKRHVKNKSIRKIRTKVARVIEKPKIEKSKQLI